jgi:hypothetical protein
MLPMDHANGPKAKKSGWPKGRPAHPGRVNRTNQAWSRSEVKDRYRACDIASGKEIWVNILGQTLCNECFEVAYSDHRGFQACRCTVWNDGVPREASDKVSDLAAEVRRAHMIRACKA